MKLIIDRFEGEYAVIEMADKTMVNIPRVVVPDAKEGDVIIVEIDKGESKDRKDEIDSLMDELFD